MDPVRRGGKSGELALYKRLPHGPHKLGRDEVARHQRARVHGAMIEAVARRGYRRTSIKEIVALAGISRRSFYEQFANREDCFLVTFDLVVGHEIRQIGQTYLATGGTWETRARAAFERCAKAIGGDEDRAILVLLEAQTAGPDGLLRLRRALEVCERRLAMSFAEAPGVRPLPAPIVRGIVGGLYGTAYAYLRDGCAPRRLDLAGEMLRWTLLFQTPSAERMSVHLTTGLVTRAHEVLSPDHTLNGRVLEAHGPSNPARLDTALSDPARLMQAMLRLATQEDYYELSAASISNEADLPIDVFWELFRSRDECFLAALARILR